MSEFTFVYGSIEFKVSWGMLFQRRFWVAFSKEGGTVEGVDMIVSIIYDGNKTYHLLNGSDPVFKTVTDVYKMLDSDGDAEMDLQIINTFKETQTYKSMLPAEPEPENTEKKT